MDHMLTLFAFHGGFNLSLACKGDTRWTITTAEDVGIVLGKAIRECLSGGINRHGSIILPMDEALC